MDLNINVSIELSCMSLTTNPNVKLCQAEWYEYDLQVKFLIQVFECV